MKTRSECVHDNVTIVKEIITLYASNIYYRPQFLANKESSCVTEEETKGKVKIGPVNQFGNKGKPQQRDITQKCTPNFWLKYNIPFVSMVIFKMTIEIFFNRKEEHICCLYAEFDTWCFVIVGCNKKLIKHFGNFQQKREISKSSFDACTDDSV